MPKPHLQDADRGKGSHSDEPLREDRTPSHPTSWCVEQEEDKCWLSDPSASGLLDFIELEVDPGQLIDTKRLRRIFGGRSSMWVWRHVRSGNLPEPISIGGRNFWSPVEIRQRIKEFFAWRNGKTDVGK